jgi:hypothetical protein
MAEQRTFNPLVQGSTPWRPTQPEQTFQMASGAYVTVSTASQLSVRFGEGGPVEQDHGVVVGGVTWLRRARRDRPSSVPPPSLGCSADMPPVCPGRGRVRPAEGAVLHARWPLPEQAALPPGQVARQLEHRGNARTNDVRDGVMQT